MSDMHERRLELIGLGVQVEMLDHIEYVAEKKASEMGERVGGKCKENFDSVLTEIRGMKSSQELSIKENTLISQAAVDGATANGLAIKALAESLAGTITVESGVKKGAGIIGWLFNIMGKIGEKWVSILALIASAVAIFHGHWPKGD